MYERAGVLAITSSASAAKVSDAGSFIYRTWNSDAAGVKKLADYLGRRHKRVGVLYEQTEYAEGLMNGLIQHRGTLEVLTEGYVPGVNDFRTVITKFQNKTIDGIFLDPQGDSTLVPMLEQLHQLQAALPRYAMYYGASQSVLQQPGALADGLIFIDAPDAEDIMTPAGSDLLAEFRTRYAINFSTMLILTTIEAFRAVDAATRHGGDPREFLNRTRFQGTFGEWSFDTKGDIVGVPFVIKRLNDGRITKVAD